MPKNLRNCTFRMAAFLPALALLAACTPAPDTTLQLRILETTDLHMHIVDYDYFQDQPSPAVGLARTATLIRAAREEVDNSILVDNGDLLQGNPLGDFIARQRGLQRGRCASDVQGHEPARLRGRQYR